MRRNRQQRRQRRGLSRCPASQANSQLHSCRSAQNVCMAGSECPFTSTCSFAPVQPGRPVGGPAPPAAAAPERCARCGQGERSAGEGWQLWTGWREQGVRATKAMVLHGHHPTRERRRRDWRPSRPVRRNRTCLVRKLCRQRMRRRGRAGAAAGTPAAEAILSCSVAGVEHKGSKVDGRPGQHGHGYAAAAPGAAAAAAEERQRGERAVIRAPRLPVAFESSSGPTWRAAGPWRGCCGAGREGASLVHTGDGGVDESVVGCVASECRQLRGVLVDAGRSCESESARCGSKLLPVGFAAL